MAEMPTSPYLDIRNGGYYLAGTRIGLDVIVRDFQEGKSPEDIWRAYPSSGRLAQIYGAITFLLEHPEVVEQYLQDQDRLWEQLKPQYPIPPEMLQRFYRAKEFSRKSA